jgi:hypothetical protein
MAGGGHVHIPWYATGLQHDNLAAELAKIAPVAMRYGATSYAVYRHRDDRYKFFQVAEFEDKGGFEQYWYGPEFTDFRVNCSSWYQVPVVYGWTDRIAHGTLNGNGGNGNGAEEPVEELVASEPDSE